MLTISNECESKYKELLELEKSNKRLAMHSFHRYYGKLIPAIPSTFIKLFTNKNDVVYDPFTGSGTTGVEALVHERNFIGTEVNPLSYKISLAKTSKLDDQILYSLNNKLIEKINNNKIQIKDEEIPYVINRDHWFKSYVQYDLMKIIKAMINMFNEIELDNKSLYINFYETIISSIIRNVSNADNMHVFPGISKRMRELEKLGKNNINVLHSFYNAIQKKSKYYQIYNNNTNNASIFCQDSTESINSEWYNKADLIVTNPPYISSVRYIETLKLELYWLEYIKNQSDYNKLSKKMIGNDRLIKEEYETINYTKYDEINKIIKQMSMLDKKSAKIIEKFFTDMEKIIQNMYKILKNGKKAVIKISDSKMKKINIQTGILLTNIAEQNGFKLVDKFTDKINNNSRSLTLARNTYSDIITEDYILIWEKI